MTPSLEKPDKASFMSITPKLNRSVRAAKRTRSVEMFVNPSVAKRATRTTTVTQASKLIQGSSTKKQNVDGLGEEAKPAGPRASATGSRSPLERRISLHLHAVLPGIWARAFD